MSTKSKHHGMAGELENRIVRATLRLHGREWALERQPRGAEGDTSAFYRVIDGDGRPKSDYLVPMDLVLWVDGFLTCLNGGVQ